MRPDVTKMGWDGMGILEGSKGSQQWKLEESRGVQGAVGSPDSACGRKLSLVSAKARETPQASTLACVFLRLLCKLFILRHPLWA